MLQIQQEHHELLSHSESTKYAYDMLLQVGSQAQYDELVPVMLAYLHGGRVEEYQENTIGSSLWLPLSSGEKFFSHLQYRIARSAADIAEAELIDFGNYDDKYTYAGRKYVTQVIAHLCGLPIQYRNLQHSSLREWEDIDNPIWSRAGEYRIKPDPPPVAWVVADTGCHTAIAMSSVFTDPESARRVRNPEQVVYGLEHSQPEEGKVYKLVEVPEGDQ